MESFSKYDISYFGEFKDKAIEKEFLENDMKRYAKVIGPVALIFGIIYMLFIISDYFAIENTFSFLIILIIRVLFFGVSLVVYLSIKKIKNYANLAYLITAYEILAIVAFILIIFQYESLTFLSFFSLMAITLAVYITPNKLINVQIISSLFCLLFFIFPAKHIEGLENSIFWKIIAYNLIIIVYCNIGAYLTNFYKRKQFADSKELLRLSTMDPLTGIYNRAKFDEELNQWIDFSNRYENPLSMVIIDIDNFKQINDNFGHLIGDDILRNIAATIKMEIRNTDIFARWGGDEFLILLPNTDIMQAMEMSERIRMCIQTNKYDNVESITCSFGLVTLNKEENSESLLQRADIFLYDAKRCGKNAVISEVVNTVEQSITDISAGFVF